MTHHCRVCARVIRPITAQNTDNLCRPCFKNGFAEFLFDPTLSRARKIQAMALRFIGKAAGNVEQWKYTVLGKIHPALAELVKLGEDEQVIVSAYINGDAWYCFTTEKMTGVYQGTLQEFIPHSGPFESHVGNFKGHPIVRPTETMTLTRGDEPAVRFLFETGAASMAPIYYEIFWSGEYPRIKFPDE